jgi:hypothetical protein
MLEFALDSISCISVITYFYIYIVGDQIFTTPLDEICFHELPYGIDYSKC